jgi:DNA-binding MarR family transcriptional regulator
VPAPADSATPIDYGALAHFRFEVRRFLVFSERAAHAAGLEPQQHQLLLALRGFASPTRPPTIGNIAEWLLIQHHSAVELVDRAVARGLVRRRQTARDRRRVFVELTPAGDELLSRLSRQHHEELEATAPALVDALITILGSTLAIPAHLLEPIDA